MQISTNELRVLRMLNRAGHQLRDTEFDREQIKDLLRYDTAFFSSIHHDIVAFPRFKSRDGHHGGKPTVDRWLSRGIRLREMDPVADDYIQGHLNRKNQTWITYIHPLETDKFRTDYSRLVPRSLEQYLTAQDRDELQLFPDVEVGILPR